MRARHSFLHQLFNPGLSRQLISVAGYTTLALMSLWLSASAHAQTRTYKHENADGTVIFSDAPIYNGQVQRTSYSSVTRIPMAANPCKGFSVAQLDAKGQNLDALFSGAANAYNVDAILVKAVARAESCFDPQAVSRVGAQGIMQLMPPTAEALGVTDSFNATQNINGGARYLADMLARYDNNRQLALAAYNAGPGNVDRYGGVPPFDETQRYIVSVGKFYEHYKTSSFATTLANSQ